MKLLYRNICSWLLKRVTVILICPISTYQFHFHEILYIHFAIPDFHNMYCLLPMIHSNKTVWIQMCELQELLQRCTFITLVSLAKCKLHMCWFNSWHTGPLIETDNWVAGRGTDLLIISNGPEIVFVSLWNVFTHTSVHLQYLCKTCDNEKCWQKISELYVYSVYERHIQCQEKIKYNLFLYEVWFTLYVKGSKQEILASQKSQWSSWSSSTWF